MRGVVSSLGALARRLQPFLLRGAMFLLAGFLIFLSLNVIFPLPPPPEYSTIILDHSGDMVHAFLTTDEKWRFKTELHEVSPLLRKTILHKEDKYFYYHPGVNPVSVLRALVMNALRGKRTSGASTITMQVARLLEPRRRTYVSKIIEMFRAFQLEWKYTKDEILQLYLNKIPYSGNIEGVKSASWLYFNKNPDHLSLAEITALSIIPNRPTSLKPGERNDLITEERNRWLLRFEKDGLFDKTVIADALAEPLTVSRKPAPRYAPHFSYRVRNLYKKDIIQTYLQLQTQQKIEKLVSDYVTPLRALNIHHAAVVVIDNRTHGVVAYVGSADFFDQTDGGQVNGAAAVRQPGSTLKPLIYGLCMDAGLLTPKQVITDVPININGYAPENFDSKYNGYVTVEFALENSLNIPAVKSLHALGKDVMIEKLIACGFGQIKARKEHLGLSLALGGCGATLEELTALYSVLANEGRYLPIRFAKTTDTSSGYLQILSHSAAFMITEILAKTTRPDMPASWMSSAHTPRIAWKTGTSYGRRDAWSIGYNRNYTVGVWVGNFSGEGVPELTGASIATPLLFKIFNTIDYNSTAKWYEMPRECGIRLVCSATGMPPNEFCHATVMDYFLPLVSPNTICTHEISVAVSADEKISYCKNCLPPAGYKEKLYPNILPEMQRYYDENHIAYVRIPPHNPDCEIISQNQAPQIVFPVNGTEYLISKNNPEPLQLKCNTPSDVHEVYWYINDRLLQKSKAGAAMFFTPAEGEQKISCTDSKGRTTHIRITVKYVDY
ncbi:MAG: penicillin-binding protein 1C [Chitinophagales bacterium]|nr:penicillin-binding protein 1C [Chitinophagales bacterium]MDW8418129.1 penicillin-binding protein 1C [Chitinophagales bacterium]